MSVKLLSVCQSERKYQDLGYVNNLNTKRFLASRPKTPQLKQTKIIKYGTNYCVWYRPTKKLSYCRKPCGAEPAHRLLDIHGIIAVQAHQRSIIRVAKPRDRNIAFLLADGVRSVCTAHPVLLVLCLYIVYYQVLRVVRGSAVSGGSREKFVTLETSR